MSGHGDLGAFGGLSEVNGPLLAALAARELPGSPKSLTVAAALLGRYGTGSPKTLTVVLVSGWHISPIRRLSVH